MHATIVLLLALSAIPLTPQQDAKIKRLEDKFMAPCCYSQSIREHMSLEAEQMREEVTAMVVSGKSEQEIINYYKAKYGETILVVPDGMAGRLTFGIPVAVFVASLCLVLLALRRSTTRKAAVIAEPALNIPDEELQGIRRQIRDEIGEG